MKSRLSVCRSRLAVLMLTATSLVGCGRDITLTASVPAASGRIAIKTLVAAPTATATVTFPPPTATAVPPTATSTPTATPTPLPPTATPIPPTETAAPADTQPPVIDPSSEDEPPLPGQHPYAVTLPVTYTNGLIRSVTVDYLLYLPYDYGQDPARQWPLIVFLHGSGERGYDATEVAANGLPQLLTTRPDFPFIVLSPQVPPEETWNTQLSVLNALLNRIQADYAVDATRVYLTGMSMGGFGAWAMALRYPQRFAALVPIAGGWDSESDVLPRNICDIKDMPVWVFHGQQDTIVLPKKDEMMVDALRQCGSTVQFTVYPDADHKASFEMAYAEPGLYAWLLEQHLP
jgi:pimeloyl-ACP methyl ester carboxylesterase